MVVNCGRDRLLLLSRQANGLRVAAPELGVAFFVEDDGAAEGDLFAVDVEVVGVMEVGLEDFLFLLVAGFFGVDVTLGANEPGAIEDGVVWEPTGVSVLEEVGAEALASLDGLGFGFSLCVCLRLFFCVVGQTQFGEAWWHVKIMFGVAQAALFERLFQ